MKYSIRWSRKALDALGQLWLDNPDRREEITQAAAAIDQLLAMNPREQGEDRDHGRRIFFVPPLVVLYSLDAEHNEVRVLNVRDLKRRKTE